MRQDMRLGRNNRNAAEFDPSRLANVRGTQTLSTLRSKYHIATNTYNINWGSVDEPSKQQRQSTVLTPS